MLENIRNKKWYIAIGVGILLFITIAFITFKLKSYQAESSPLESAYSNSEIEIIDSNNQIIIKPNNYEKDSAIIYYPGGLVEPEAYIFKLSRIALSKNMQVFIVKFPLNLAVFNINKADDIINDNQDIDSWTIMGHSLGGAMACRYANDHQDKIHKLVLLASYCDVDISSSNLEVYVLYGSEDKVLNRSTFENSLDNLPEDNKVIEITGMNHAQFGNYGEQEGDGDSKISDEDALDSIIKSFNN